MRAVNVQFGFITVVLASKDTCVDDLTLVDKENILCYMNIRSMTFDVSLDRAVGPAAESSAPAAAPLGPASSPLPLRLRFTSSLLTLFPHYSYLNSTSRCSCPPPTASCCTGQGGGGRFGGLCAHAAERVGRARGHE